MRPAWTWLALAVFLVAAGLLGGLWLMDGSPHEPVRLADAPAPPTLPASRPAAVPALAPVPVPEPLALGAAAASSPPASQDLADHVPPGTEPSMQQVIGELQRRGIRTGLGAFNPPGTRPHLIGLAVPEDFALPPGYVRHHQATDDGQRIEAILMFAPDFRLFDAQGRELQLPANRVVPAELAPPGLPLRRIELPPPAAASRP